MLLGRLRIRGKLALLVAIPLLAVVGLTLPVVVTRVQSASQAAHLARLTRVANQVGILLQDVQQERLLSVAYLLGLAGRAEVVKQVSDVDDQLAEVRLTQAADLPASTVKALDGITALAPLRAAVLARRTTPDQVIGGFGTFVNGAIDSLRLLRGADLTSPTGRQVMALDLVLRLNESINLGGVTLTYAAATGSPTAIVQFSVNLLNATNLQATLASYGRRDEVALYTQVVQVLTNRLGADFLIALQTDAAAALRRVTGPQVFTTTEAVNIVGRFVEQKITADVIAQVGGRQRTQTRVAYAAIGLALLLLVLMISLSAAVARAVARPLTRLTRSAERVAQVAEDELVRVADDETETVRPVHLDAVDTSGRDEIGELARAFERVQTTAAGLVERQAVSRRNVAQMFGHVGRRTQNLVGRQLALIDRLERVETDPTRMSDLYRLDHVSNRLRRNAGSLVVLSGGTGSDDHLAPMPLGDVVRLALGEIEDYTRVVVDVPAHLTIVPAVVGDLVLVAAELMENATIFSPPHTSVSVFASPTQQGARLSIVDHGIGLSAERLAEENARLARRERLDLAPTEVLGLFVVGRLARRYDLAVRLAHTPGGGVTADVELPDGLLASWPATPVLVLGAGDPAGSAGRPEIEDGPPRPLRAVGRVTATALDSAPSVFNITTLRKTLETGSSWNAFAPSPRTPAPPAQPAPADPAAARALIEDLEAGVTRAEQAAAPVADRPTNGAPRPPAGTARVGGLASLPPRRVPGATLGAHLPPTAAPRPATQPAVDPEAVRAAVEQFEFGIARALREVDPDHRDEKESG
ncbi:MAG: hypothetical protein V7603_2539 [Micromonosporaceae bacterium]